MPVVESNIYALWCAAQASKGAPAAAAGARRLIQVAGDLTTAREDGSENFSDLDRFGDSADFVNTILGQGAVTVQAQADELAYLLWMFFGQETFTAQNVAPGSESPPKFEFVPGTTTGKWATFWKRVGLSNIVREKFNDCKMTSIRLEGSSANKIVKVIPNIISLDAGEKFAADPAAQINYDQDPFVYTEGEGRFMIDGTVFRGHSQFAVVVDDAQTPYYGDSVGPQDLVAGNAQITLEGITILLDQDGLAHYNQQIYGDPAPAAGTKPIKSIPSIGSYEFELRRGIDDGAAGAEDRLSMKVELPGVKWSPDVAVSPNPEGGAIELPFGGAMRKVSGQPGIRITVETGAGDNAAHA